MIVPATALTLAALFGFLSVTLGAFAAHGLKGRLSAASLEIFQTGVLYQSIHALALMALGAIFIAKPDLLLIRGASWAIISFTLGILVFSGSLYVLALTGIKALGAITPIGGVFFLAGWISVLIFSVTLRNQA